MAVTYLFLDTEWADPEGRELVSLALVSQDGEAVFYAERDPLPVNPTGFVKDSVYPLLDRGSVALVIRSSPAGSASFFVESKLHMFYTTTPTTAPCSCSRSRASGSCRPS